ncbi:MAG: 3-hydroxybutyrate dehydrogenase [Bacteroidia bacterium]|nr:3-hydroxybutyrate dehydrogenase [Bacteroidia bacterium]MCZ2248610.1 3-hydroxybutyrate dehydrogenase [Bacteroidia bacterium]
MLNKTVLITGGTSGIGLGIAHSFAQAGYHLVLVGLEKNGNDIANEIARQYKIKSLFFNTDISNFEEVSRLCKDALSHFKQIEVLVNNAGIQYVSPVEKFPVEKWNAIININLNAAFYTTHCLWESMKKAQYGRIINIASAHGLVASEFKSAYVAAKHGIVGFTKVLALEGAPHGITANAICPGYVKTPLVEKQIADQAIAHGIPESQVINDIMLVKQPVKSFVTVEAIGALAVYLTSPQANLINGASLPIEGGWTAQ